MSSHARLWAVAPLSATIVAVFVNTVDSTAATDAKETGTNQFWWRYPDADCGEQTSTTHTFFLICLRLTKNSNANRFIISQFKRKTSSLTMRVSCAQQDTTTCPDSHQDMVVAKAALWTSAKPCVSARRDVEDSITHTGYVWTLHDKHVVSMHPLSIFK